jgi:hypothetical protein
MAESRRFEARAGSMARSRRVGSIGANRADRLGRGRSHDSVPCGIELDAGDTRDSITRVGAREDPCG